MFSLRRDAAGKDSYLSDGYGNHKAMVFPSVMYGCEIWTVVSPMKDSELGNPI